MRPINLWEQFVWHKGRMRPVANVLPVPSYYLIERDTNGYPVCDEDPREAR